MAKKSDLPANVHEHFRKANILHTYVQKELGEARNHALEIGQELLAAKQAVPHGSWEDECKRLFDGSPRTAQFYMQFARDFGKLKSAGTSALLMLEGTLEGAAKAAKRAANPKPKTVKEQMPDPELQPRSEGTCNQLPETLQGDYDDLDEPIDADSKPVDEPVDYGKCPNCAGTKWNDEDPDEVFCVKCHQPHSEPAGDVDEDRINTQRQKTVKTAEALMRAFDDLQCMKARGEHGEVIEDCKSLITKAKGWR